MKIFYQKISVACFSQLKASILSPRKWPEKQYLLMIKTKIPFPFLTLIHLQIIADILTHSWMVINESESISGGNNSHIFRQGPATVLTVPAHPNDRSFMKNTVRAAALVSELASILAGIPLHRTSSAAETGQCPYLVSY